MAKQNVETTAATGKEAAKRNNKRTKDTQKMTGKEGIKQNKNTEDRNIVTT